MLPTSQAHGNWNIFTEEWLDISKIFYRKSEISVLNVKKCIKILLNNSMKSLVYLF